jgi:phage head maturation protease
MTLNQDNIGLKVNAQLDRTDPDVQRILPKMRRGDLNEMSMAFRVNGQAWDETFTDRTISEINLARGDVSIVTFGANPATVAALRAALADDDVRRALFEQREDGTEDAPCVSAEPAVEEPPAEAEEPAEEAERSSTLEYMAKLLDARRID